VNLNRKFREGKGNFTEEPPVLAELFCSFALLPGVESHRSVSGDFFRMRCI